MTRALSWLGAWMPALIAAGWAARVWLPLGYAVLAAAVAVHVLRRRHHYRARLRHPLPRTLRRAVLARDGWTCAYCGVCSRRRAQVDHIRPVAAGGTDDMANLTCLCAYHNRVKSDYWPDPPRYHPRPGYANRRLARAILKAELADRQVTQ